MYQGGATAIAIRTVFDCAITTLVLWGLFSFLYWLHNSHPYWTCLALAIIVTWFVTAWKG